MMEDFLDKIPEFIGGVAVTVGALLTQFKEADNRMKAVYLIGFMVAIALVLMVLG